MKADIPLSTVHEELPASQPVASADSKSAEHATAAPPTKRRSSLRNILWNWVGVVADVGTGLVVTPLLIRTLGDETYGIWILIGAFTGYFGMLDLGLRGAVGRFVALHSARGERHLVQAVLSTATVALSGIGLVAFAGISLMAWLLPSLFTIPAEQTSAAQTALLIVGGQLGLMIMFRAFDAALWAHQRFDLLNLVDIPTALLRLTLTWWFVTGGGLVALAWINFGVMLANGLAKAWFSHYEIPGLMLSPAFARRSMLREMLGYSLWNFIISVMGMARTRGMPLVIGAFVGLRVVGPFSVIMRLTSIAMMILSATTGVFTPVSVVHHANDDHARRRLLVLEGSQLSFTFGLYFVSLFVSLGGPLLSIWIRPDFAEYAPLLSVIGLGELLPMAMSIPQGVLQAMAKHRRLAWLVVSETVATLVGCAVLGSWLDLWGIALALAASATVFRGWFVLLRISQIIEVGIVEFVYKSLLTPLIACLPAMLGLYLGVRYHVPTTWLELFGFTLLFSAFFATSVVIGLIGTRRTLNHLHEMVGAVRCTA